jgi:hypothetical protein
MTTVSEENRIPPGIRDGSKKLTANTRILHGDRRPASTTHNPMAAGLSWREFFVRLGDGTLWCAVYD